MMCIQMGGVVGAVSEEARGIVLHARCALAVDFQTALEDNQTTFLCPFAQIRAISSCKTHGRFQRHRQVQKIQAIPDKIPSMGI